jgi:cytidylate kinase
MARTIAEVVSTEDAVIVGRAGHVVAGAGPSVLRVLCVAPEATRTARVAKAHAVSEFEAQTRVRESDRDRAEFHRQFFDAAWLDPSAYDLVINTGSMAVASAVEAIVAAASRLVGRPSATVAVAHH